MVISENQFKELKSLSKLIVEENTFIQDFIRIFEFQGEFIFQEKTPKGEILIRKFSDIKTANNLVQERLEIYEKMWNGCGCKIDYYT